MVYQVLRGTGRARSRRWCSAASSPPSECLLAVVRHRRIDAIGALVLLGIAVGTILGLASGSAKLVLVEGSVPTGIFGLVCLGSLWAPAR